MGIVVRSCFAFAVAAVGLAAPRAMAGPDEEYARRVQEGLDRLDREKVAARTTGLAEKSDEQLAESRRELANGQAAIHRSWRKVQAASEVLSVAGRLVEIRWAHHALAMYTIEVERTQRIDAIHARENDITTARYQEAYYSAFVPKRSRNWRNDPEFEGFRAEERRVQSWFVEALLQQKREAEGGDAATAATLLDEMRKDIASDQALVNAAVFAIDKEVARRKGIDLKTPQEQAQEEEAREQERTEEHARYAVRLVPYRTEYEAKTGEVVDAAFQVFKGAPEYLVSTHQAETLEGPRFLRIAQAGDFSLPYTFRKAGNYTASVRVYDAQGEIASTTISIRVTGEPLPPTPKPPPTEKKGPVTDTPRPPAPAEVTAPIPLVGTFDVLAFRLGSPQADPTSAPLRITPVPLTITIDAAGSIRGSARYSMPVAEMKPATEPRSNRRWTSRFDVTGSVDWTSGKVHLDVRDGVDEAGFEKDVDKLGHWRQFHRYEYSGSFDGWTIPGPDASAWLARLATHPGIAEALKQSSLETVAGLPSPEVRADGTLAFTARGFFGSPDLGAPAATPRFAHRRYTKVIDHMGYDGRNAKDEDRTAERQKSEDAGASGWYVRIVGLAADAPPPEDAPPPDPKSDLLAFGLWPTKPMTTKVGGTVRARAMAVYRENVFDAVDRSKQVTWTAEGLEVLGDGSFRATKPGTYTVTARTGDGPNAMTSTLSVVVEK